MMTKLFLLVCALVTMMPIHDVVAEDMIFIPVNTYRTGPFSMSGRLIANGMSDYLNMLNIRDGGVGGIKLDVEECETGLDEWRGMDCYKNNIHRHPVVVSPWSTDIAKSVLPHAEVDKVPVLTMMYGISAFADGEISRWAFNTPNTYTDSIVPLFSHIQSIEKEKIKGTKIGYMYMDYGWAIEPLNVLKKLADDYKFELLLYPVPIQELESQSNQWAQIDRDKPDYLIMYGWDVMQSEALTQAVKHKFPIERFYSSYWISEGDISRSGVGDKLIGMKMLTWTSAGRKFPFMNDIQEYVYRNNEKKINSRGVGSVLYNYGVYNALLIAEAIKTAQHIKNKSLIDGSDMRDGLESLKISEQRLIELGMQDFTQPISHSCKDHNGHAKNFIQEFNGKEFVKVSPWLDSKVEYTSEIFDEYLQYYLSQNPSIQRNHELCNSMKR